MSPSIIFTEVPFQPWSSASIKIKLGLLASVCDCKIWKNSRNVESKLIEHKIPFDYIDLDTHNPKNLVTNLIPRTHGETDSDRGVSPNKRYDLATRIAKEYIKTRGLTDLRLSGRVNDRI